MERRKVFSVILALAVALATSALAFANPVRADDPRTDDSIATWYNGNRSSSVYCVNANGIISGQSFVGGDISVLGSNDHQELWVSEAQLNLVVNSENGLVADDGAYKLYRTSDGSFELDSTSDTEGKIFLGRFSLSCTSASP